jgi:hypothetical protein
VPLVPDVPSVPLVPLTPELPDVPLTPDVPEVPNKGVDTELITCVVSIFITVIMLVFLIKT